MYRMYGIERQGFRNANSLAFRLTNAIRSVNGKRTERFVVNKKGMHQTTCTPGDKNQPVLLTGQRLNLDFNAAVFRPVLLGRIGHQRLVWACTLSD